MEKKVSAFFTEHQRFPTLKESELIFKKIGCSDMKQTFYEEYKNNSGEIYQQFGGYTCTKYFKTYKYSFKTTDLNTKTKESFAHGAYVIAFSKGKTNCGVSFNKSGKLQNSFNCQQFSCGNKLFGSH